jgi:hypothetical protein
LQTKKLIHEHNMIKSQETHSESNPINKIPIETKNQCSQREENLFLTYIFANKVHALT